MPKPFDPRHLARRLALQALFEWSFLSKSPAELLSQTESQAGDDETEAHLEVLKANAKAWNLCQALVEGVVNSQEKIDKIIERAAPEWPLTQIPKTDLTILRLATFELLEKTETPPKVAIDEAVELGKEFGSDNTAKFVNGVLGTVLRNMSKND